MLVVGIKHYLILVVGIKHYLMLVVGIKHYLMTNVGAIITINNTMVQFIDTTLHGVMKLNEMIHIQQHF